MKITPIEREKREYEKQRTKAIKELCRIEQKYGSDLFRSACNRKLTIDRQKRQQEQELKKAQENLEQLKTGKPLNY